MHQNTIAWQQEIAAPAMKGMPSPDVHLINMVYALSLELTANPTICADGADGLWIYYEGACFACEELLQEYGLSLAVISRRYPLRFYGNAGGLESVELESALSADGQRLTLMKKNVSGQDFDQISNLCLRIKAGSASCRDAIKAALSALDYRRDYLALRRTSYAQQALADAGELNPDTYYRYIPLSGDGEATAAAVNLPLERQVELWLLLLQDHISVLELSYVLEAVEREALYSYFTWELSLRLAMSKSGCRVCYGPEGFQLIDGEGKRLRYGFNKGSDGERLLLKFLFPAIPASRQQSL